MDAMQVYEDAHGIFCIAVNFQGRRVRFKRLLNVTRRQSHEGFPWRQAANRSGGEVPRVFPYEEFNRSSSLLQPLTPPWQLMSRPYIIINSVGD